ncbi:hypothetical protein ACSSS7_006064 [Eimeria intestinalis]
MKAKLSKPSFARQSPGEAATSSKEHSNSSSSSSSSKQYSNSSSSSSSSSSSTINRFEQPCAVLCLSGGAHVLLGAAPSAAAHAAAAAAAAAAVVAAAADVSAAAARATAVEACHSGATLAFGLSASPVEVYVHITRAATAAAAAAGAGAGTAGRSSSNGAQEEERISVSILSPTAALAAAAAAPLAAAAAAAGGASLGDDRGVHKEQLASVPNALSGRDSVDVIVHGMDGIPTEIIQEKLAKYQQRADGKATRKRERANWAQVTMAPASLEHFILLAQQGQLPQFEGVPPTPVIPGLAATPAGAAAAATAVATAGAAAAAVSPCGLGRQLCKTIDELVTYPVHFSAVPSFGAPGGPPQPPALPVPPNLQGLLSQATGVPLPGMPGAPAPQQGGFGFPMGPPSPQPLVPPQQQGMMMGQGAGPPGLAPGSTPGAPAPPAGAGAPPAAAPLAAAPTQGRGGPNSMVPPGPPPVFSTPVLPSNTKLMYPDDTMSVEERRASEMRRAAVLLLHLGCTYATKAGRTLAVSKEQQQLSLCSRSCLLSAAARWLLAVEAAANVPED